RNSACWRSWPAAAGGCSPATACSRTSGATRTRSTAARWTRTCGGCARSSARPPGSWKRSGAWATALPRRTDLAALTVLFAAAFALAAAAWWWERRQRLATESRHGDELARQSARVAAKLDEQAGRTAALFDRMVEGIAVTDGSGRIRLANRAAGDLFGFEAPAAGRTLLEAMRR